MRRTPKIQPTVDYSMNFFFSLYKFYVEHQFCELILWQWRRANTFEFLMPTSELSTRKKANLLSAISWYGLRNVILVVYMDSFTVCLCEQLHIWMIWIKGGRKQKIIFRHKIHKVNGHVANNICRMYEEFHISFLIFALLISHHNKISPINEY